EMRSSRGNRHNATGRMSRELAFIEHVAHTDVEHPCDDRVDAILAMPMRHHSRVAGQAHANDVWARAPRIADQYGQPRDARKSGQRLPHYVFRANHAE